MLKGSIRLSLFSIWPSIGTENSIPEKMDHREIAVCMPVMNKVQFLFASEPCKPLKPRSLYVVFLVKKNVRVERHRTCGYLNREEINGQYDVYHICARTWSRGTPSLLAYLLPRLYCARASPDRRPCGPCHGRGVGAFGTDIRRSVAEAINAR